MQKRVLGSSEINASLIGFGCWKAGKAGWPGADDMQTLAAIDQALALGINYFDTAPIYGFGHSEQILGKALKGRREQAYIATKVGLVWDERKRVRKDLSANSVLREIDASLKRLETDYIDLIQIHWDDGVTPVEEVMVAFETARRQGKVRYFGVCNLGVALLERARQVADIVSVQVLYSLADRNAERYLQEKLPYRTEREILPYCRKHNIGLIPYSPLGQGFLSDDFDWHALPKKDIRRLNSMFEQQAQRREQWLQTAHGLGMSLSQLALAWLARQQAVATIIIGSTDPVHIERNVQALERLADLPDIL